MKQKNGHFSLNTKDPMFEEARQVYERKFGKSQTKAMPKSIVKGLYFQGSETAFQASLDAGDLDEIEDDGVKYYAFKELKCGTEKGSVQSQTSSSGKMKISAGDYEATVALVDSLGWSFQLSDKDKKKMLAIGNGGLPDSVTTSLGNAKGACEKLEKQAMSLVSKVAAGSVHKDKLLQNKPKLFY